METNGYLLTHGWKYDSQMHICQWRDPINKLSWYTERNAVEIQKERDNRRMKYHEQFTVPPHLKFRNEYGDGDTKTVDDALGEFEA